LLLLYYLNYLNNCNSILFFFNDTPTTNLYTLSLHDALPIYTFGSIEKIGMDRPVRCDGVDEVVNGMNESMFVADDVAGRPPGAEDRKSTRLNSSHVAISYAVFCLKKKKKKLRLNLTKIAYNI